MIIYNYSGNHLIYTCENHTQRIHFILKAQKIFQRMIICLIVIKLFFHFFLNCGKEDIHQPKIKNAL